MAGVNRDLWGEVIEPPEERRGRPTHVVTEEKRIRVSVLRAFNKNHDEIAAAMGIAPGTLRRYYRRELRGGLAQKRAEVLVDLYKAGKDGNVAAMKEFLRRTDASDLVTPPMTARAPKRGKKELAALAAASPDSSTSMGALMAERAGAKMN